MRNWDYIISKKYLIFSSAIIAGIFLMDLFYPSKPAAFHMLYLIPLALLYHQSRSIILSVAISCCILVIAAPFLNPSAGDTSPQWDNRGIISLAIVTMGWVLLKFQAITGHNAQQNDLKAKHEESESQKKILTTLIDNIPLYVGIFDSNGRYTMISKNYEKAFFMSREEIIGKRLRDIIPEENIPIYEPQFLKALNGEAVEFQEETKMKNGDVIQAICKYTPVLSEDGKVLYVTVIVKDITRLVEMQKKLEKSNRNKNKILSIVSHDIRNPLSNFELFLDASKDQLLTREQQNEIIESLRENLKPIRKTVLDLLDWSKKQMQFSNVEPVEQNIQVVCDEIVDSLRANIDDKQIKLTINGSAPPILADKDCLVIMLRNILHNAVKFTPSQGEIAITYSSTDEMAGIEVRDSGDGIPQHTIDSIMSGEIVDSSPGTEGEKGTGLGLSVCYELIQQNDGELTIENSGSGASFRVMFPHFNSHAPPEMNEA